MLKIYFLLLIFVSKELYVSSWANPLCGFTALASAYFHHINGYALWLHAVLALFYYMPLILVGLWLLFVYLLGFDYIKYSSSSSRFVQFLYHPKYFHFLFFYFPIIICVVAYSVAFGKYFFFGTLNGSEFWFCFLNNFNTGCFNLEMFVVDPLVPYSKHPESFRFYNQFFGGKYVWPLYGFMKHFLENMPEGTITQLVRMIPEHRLIHIVQGVFDFQVHLAFRRIFSYGVFIDLADWSSMFELKFCTVTIELLPVAINCLPNGVLDMANVNAEGMIYLAPGPSELLNGRVIMPRELFYEMLGFDKNLDYAFQFEQWLKGDLQLNKEEIRAKLIDYLVEYKKKHNIVDNSSYLAFEDLNAIIYDKKKSFF